MKRHILYKHFAVSWSNFILTAMTIYLFLGMPLAMRQHGWSGAEIGMFQLAGLPVLLKFFMGAPIERFAFKQANYFKWSLLLSVGVAIGLFLLSRADIEHVSFSQVFFATILTSVFATWLDIPVNALAIRLLDEKEQLRNGVLRSSVAALASIVGGGIMIFVYSDYGWQAPIYVFMFALILSLILLFLLEKQEKNVGSTSVYSMKKKGGLSLLKGYFHQPDKRWWHLILVFYFPFIGCAWLFLKPTLLDFGVSLDDIAWLATLGGIVAAIASFSYAVVLKRLPGRGLLLSASVFNIIALYIMLSLTMAVPERWQLITAVVVLAIALGLSSGVIMGIMMTQCRQQHEAFDYSLQSSLFALSRMLVPALAGVLLDKLGYQGLYGGLLVGAVAVTMVTFLMLRSSPHHLMSNASQ
ncbi:MFS transporter [Marinomonas mediterranea]|uniref:Major facilitator superfamily MFS_1 n=1 Tax=Marinomonas mediterranea (strain ATCC 700492 / JCM 21426 / NBRC 103028 / MMB-1) TaxID=717774 RepID=F2JVE9_MARM1|nr:MFS transporter [Marinomonas mediterranea]ADZ89407.1 major facilitator superfamily MFS_1 [Marinomonas mediterranea MMB-1]WCN15665.1 MFS transporter [Marinomonas mediterranea MMB-1]